MSELDLPEDRGCLRWVLGVPLAALVYLPASLSCYLALVMQPQSPHDQLREDVRFMAAVCVFLCLVGLLITITPVFRRTLGRWWFAMPFLLAALAYARAQTV
ncbi:hypothetical protein [Streptomyces sp. NPDC054797]